MARKKKEPFAGLTPVEKPSYDPYAARIKGLDPTNDNKYVLMISQPGPFAVRNLLFMVDDLEVLKVDSNAPTVVGYDTNKNVIISFPVGYQYLLFHKELCDMVKWSDTNPGSDDQDEGPKPTKVGQYL